MNTNDDTISWQDRALLREFFSTVLEWMQNHMDPTLTDLKDFTALYENFLNNHHLKGNKVLMTFLLELKFDQLNFENKNSNSKVIKVLNKDITHLNNPTLIQNSTIAKWYRESRITRHLIGFQKDTIKKRNI